MRADPSHGFTLIEVLVALSVLSIAAMALLNVQGAGAGVSASVREKLFAEIVAENRMIEAVSAVDDGPAGVTSGEEVLAGQTWLWRQTIAPTSDSDIRRIHIAVSGGADDSPVTGLTGFRGLK
jgi:general secretion pathway protein I